MSTKEPKDMSRQEVTAIVIGVLILLCVAPIVIADRCSNSLTFLDRVLGRKCSGWAEIIFDYQSLISGIFAIVAAYIAVFQMRESEQEQRQRHREIVAIETRDVRLAIHRAFTVVRSSMLKAMEWNRQLLVLFDTPQSQLIWNADALRTYCNCMYLCLKFRRVARAPDVTSGFNQLAPTYGAQLQQCLDWANAICDGLELSDERDIFLGMTAKLPVGGAPPHFDENLKFVVEMFQDSSEAFLELCKGLETIWDDQFL